MTPLALLLEEAIILAADCHRKQTDKAGRPYILHPLRVMFSFTEPGDDEARIAAVLHDVVEDSDMTVARLQTLGYPPSVCDAVFALSRRRYESYEVYIVRVQANPLAARVKIADLRDNLDRDRPSTRLLPDATIIKYKAALTQLMGATHS